MHKPIPPAAKQIEKAMTFHKDTRLDPWYWLRQKDDPAVIKYLKAENKYTKEILKPTEPLQEKLFQELKSKIQEHDKSVPIKDGPYWYFNEIKKDQQHPVFKRTPHGEKQKIETLLDVNLLAKNKTFCEIGFCLNSPDHRYLAYSVDETGEEEYSIFILDLQEQKLLPLQIDHACDSFEWTNDSKGFYYCLQDDCQRPKWIYAHTLGQDQSQDLLVYEEEDPRFFVSIDKSESNRFIYIGSEGNNMSEWYYLDAQKINKNIRIIAPRKKDHEYDPSDHGESFYIRTNLDALDFRIVKTPIENPSQEHWEDFIPHQYQTLIEGFMVFEDFLVFLMKKDNICYFSIYNCKTDSFSELRMEEKLFELNMMSHRDYDSTILRYQIESLKHPPEVYDFDLKTGKTVLRKKWQIPDPHFKEENYDLKRIHALSRDGQKIPISLIFRKDQKQIHEAPPLLLCAYGAYGISKEVEFDGGYFPLLDRGFTVAIAHVRGGMELGQNWYLQGKLLKKENTFNDYIDCTQYLIEQQYVKKGNIIGYGGSAGGLLMGAVANRMPSLFLGFIAQVPFVDVLTTMLDKDLTLTTSEFNEWGNPEDKIYYEYIKSYSPYDNVTSQEYPSLFVTAGINDCRVPYWEPSKWIAKLRKYNTGKEPILLHVNLDSGHGGASGRYDYLKEIALELAFAIKIFTDKNK